jgi:hypothetical protein
MCLELTCLAELAYEAALSAYNAAAGALAAGSALAAGGALAASGALANAPEALGYTAAAAAGAIALLRTARYAFRPQKCATANTFDSLGPFDPLARLAQLDHKVELIAANLEAITGVHVYYAAPGGMKLHASIDCTLLSHSKELATLTVSPDVRAFLLRAQVVCLRCGYEAPH